MTFDVLSDLNWLAVIVAMIAYMVLGALWYSPVLFGNAWMKATGVEMPEEGGPGPLVYLMPAIAYLAGAIATAMLAVATGSDTLSEGIVLGLVVGVGYAVASALVAATFDTKPDPKSFFLINAGFNLLGLVVVSILVSTWN